MAATTTEKGFNFNNITQEVYDRAPIEGDNLLQMFEDGLTGGFNVLYDEGGPGPGDAMSEFRGYVHDGIFGGTWEGYRGWRTPYVPDSILQKYFSQGDLRINVEMQVKSGDVAVDFDNPVTGVLKLGGKELSVTDQSHGVGDDILFTIKDSDNIPNGTYIWNSDVAVLLTDGSGYQVNADTYPKKFITAPQYLHIYDGGTSTARWKWSTSATDSYPIVYPTATWAVTAPVKGIVPGSNSPTINLRVTDLEGFSDITAEVMLQDVPLDSSSTPTHVIGNETSGYVGVGSAFTLDTPKSIVLDVSVIKAYIDAGNDISYTSFYPVVRLRFADGTYTTLAEYGVDIGQTLEIGIINATGFSWYWKSIIELVTPTPTDDTTEDGQFTDDEGRDVVTTDDTLDTVRDEDVTNEPSGGETISTPTPGTGKDPVEEGEIPGFEEPIG